MSEKREKRIGSINTCYGGLVIKHSKTGKYYWGLEDPYNMQWEEIPYYLVDALIGFERSKERERQGWLAKTLEKEE